MKTYFSYFVIILFTLFLIISCRSTKCKDFDFSRVLSDSCLLYENYYYTNGTDTIKLKLDSLYFSKEGIKPIIYPCDARLFVLFKSNQKEFDFEFEYHFRYFEDEKSSPTTLEIKFNSNCASLDYSNQMTLHHDIRISDLIQCANNFYSPPRLFNSIRLENLKISELEFEDGEIWKLCDYKNAIQFNPEQN